MTLYMPCFTFHESDLMINHSIYNTPCNNTFHTHYSIQITLCSVQDMGIVMTMHQIKSVSNPRSIIKIDSTLLTFDRILQLEYSKNRQDLESENIKVHVVHSIILKHLQYLGVNREQGFWSSYYGTSIVELNNKFQHIEKYGTNIYHRSL